MPSLYKDAYQQLPADRLAIGAELLASEAVSDCQILEFGQVISGVVAESGRDPSRVYIQLNNKAFFGECSCEREENCEHVAALLLYAEQHTESRPPEAGNAGPVKGVNNTVSTTSPNAGSRLANTDFISDIFTKDKHQFLVYRLDYQGRHHGALRGVGDFWLSVAVCRPGNDGQHRYFPFSLSADADSYPRYVNELDREILTRVRASHAKLSSSHWLLKQKHDEDLLSLCLSSHRCLFNSEYTTDISIYLQTGPALPAQYAWHYLDDGCQQLALLNDEAALFIGLEHVFYIDHQQHCWGEVSTDNVKELTSLSERGAFSPEQTALEQVAPEQIAPEQEKQFGQHFPGIPTPALTPLVVKDEVKVAPVLMGSANKNSAGVQLGFEIEGSHRATIFCGRNDSSNITDASAQYRYQHNGTAYAVPRNADAEKQWQQMLEQCLIDANVPLSQESNTESFRFTFADATQWLRFRLGVVPALETAGFKQRSSPGFPYSLFFVESWYGEVHKEDRTNKTDTSSDWFGFELGVVVNQQDVNLLPFLKNWLKDYGVDALSNGDLPSSLLINQQLIISHTNNAFIALPLEKIQRLVQHLLELSEQRNLDQPTLSLPTSQTFRLQVLDDILKDKGKDNDNDNAEGSIAWRGDQSLLDLAQALASFKNIEMSPLPSTLLATLRPYQVEGLSWLQFLGRYGLGGILADDMGLGKTVQTIAHLLSEKAAGKLMLPVLIVAPTSVLNNWYRELARFAPSLSASLWHGSKRTQLSAPFKNSDVVITSYTLLHVDAEILLNQQFSIAILDEAQYIKNPRTKVRQAARQLQAEQRLCLSGTPVENHLGELWSLFDFVQPGLLGNQTQFNRLYKTPIEKHGQQSRLHSLAKRLAPFMLRRTKSQVASDLPEKTEIIHRLSMAEGQRELYDALRLSMHKQLRQLLLNDSLDKQRIAVLDMLLKLRQVCCHPRLLKQEFLPSPSLRSIDDSVKMAFLQEKLPELIEEGRRILLFSQFTSVLDLVAETVKELSIPYLMLTGKSHNRESLVNAFQAGEAPLFLISLKAGGTGLNLTAADTVIHYDPWWNPAVENQATDRAHRIGQSKPVFVYKLVADNTVEEKILALHERKRSLQDGIVTDKAAAPMSLGADDFDFLLQA